MGALRRTFAVGAVVLAAGCGRAPSPLITVDRTTSTHVVEVRGLPPGDVAALAAVPANAAEWQRILRVTVDGSQVPVPGRYSAGDGSIRFSPLDGLNPTQVYVAVFDARRVPGVDHSEGWRKKPVVKLIARAAGVRGTRTAVQTVYPSGAELPENLLRFYIEFSGPMGRAPALEHVRLIDADGTHVLDPFLAAEAERWTPDRTRFTLLFDPGRVKRGIEPRRDAGPALISGRRYALVIGDRWVDARGRPLHSRYRHEFTVVPAIERPLDPSAWNIAPPKAATRDPLVVTFPWALDYGLLQRALSVRRDDAEVPGEIAIGFGETRWTFTPGEPWTPGNYLLMALTLLEDPSGNRLGRTFDVVPPVREERDAITLPFTVR